MTTRSILLAAAVLFASTTAVAQEKKAENSNQPPTADTQKSEPASPKGYGYGEQPGDEAGNDSARQSSAPGREKSKMPQDQRAEGGAKKGGADRAVSGHVVRASAESVSVRGEDREVRTLTVSEKTVVLREGHRLDPTQLKEGDEVRAAVEQRGGDTVATRITVVTGDQAMQQGRGTGETVDTPDQNREGLGGHIENTHPDPEEGGHAAPPSGSR